MNTITCKKCKLDKLLEDYYKSNLFTCKICLEENRKIQRRLRSGHGKSKDDLNEQEIKYRQYVNAGNKERRKRNCIGYMISRAKTRARAKGIIFNLDKNSIKIPELCPALKIPIVNHTDNKPTANSASLDRLDNSKGYVNDNINVISNRANTIKADATFEEFEAIYKWWKSEIKKKNKKCQNTT